MQALVASVVLILLPLLFARRSTSKEREPTWRLVVYFAAIALVALAVARILPNLALGLPDAAKLALSIALVAPLAFAMGMPFPLGLRRLALADPAAIPWAWGINGTASVLSSMLATLVAVHFGFSALVALAAALYGIAALGVRRPMP